MFREMRRLKNQMSEEDTISVLKTCDEGVLGTISSNGYPYTVVLNYAYMNGKLYFHCAKEGHKLDNIIHNDKVSFTVYKDVNIIKDKFTTKYRSVTVFGRAKLIEPSKDVLMALINKYSDGFEIPGKAYVEKSYMGTQLIEVTIEHMTGKERI